MHKVDLLDVLALLGGALISLGAGMIYAPAGVIVLGVLLLAFAIVGARAQGVSGNSANNKNGGKKDGRS